MPPRRLSKSIWCCTDSRNTRIGFSFLSRRKRKRILPCKRQINCLSLSRIGLRLPLTGEAIKRESGVNPEQSRCCKFHNYVTDNLLSATGLYSGKAFVTGTSQKTCHATNFTAFEEKALSLMNRTIRLSFHSSLWFRESMFKLINSAKFIFRVRSKGFRPDTFKMYQQNGD